MSPLARALAAALASLAPGCAAPAPAGDPTSPAGPEAARAEASPELSWTSLVPAAGLGAWVPTPFGGEGEVARVPDGFQVDFGSPLSGLTWTGPPPSGDYELRLVATRLAGNDFFCGLTFPVGEAHLTFVLGGWGGAVVGLSSLDGLDASSNETRTVRGFETGRPYAVRVHVRGTLVEGWIDDERVVAIDTEGRALGLRPEVLASRPLGVACFATRARFEALAYRPLADGKRSIP